MITAGWQAISGAIQTIVKQSGLVNQAEVYAFEKNRFQGYPAVTITLKNGKGEFADTARNMRTYTFAIRVYQERLDITGGEQEAENAIRAIVDNLIGLLEQDTTQFGGVIAGKGFMKPITSTGQYIAAPDTQVRMVEFEAEFVVIE